MCLGEIDFPFATIQSMNQRGQMGSYGVKKKTEVENFMLGPFSVWRANVNAAPVF
jgi:hypothetical protein